MPNLYNLTADLGDLLGGDAIAATARGRVEVNLPRTDALIDTGTGGQIRLGNAPVTINADGTLLVEGLVGSDSTDLNIEPGTLQYQLSIEYRDPAIQGRGADRTYRSGWFFLNATSDVATVAKTVTPTVAQSGADIIAAAAFEADRAEAAAELATAPTDTQMEALVNDPASLTTGALSATYGTVESVQNARVVDTDPSSVYGTETFPVAASGEIPGWLSADGETLFSYFEPTLKDSTDGGATWRTLHTFVRDIYGMRQLPNGELLVSVEADIGTAPGEIWVSSGYPTLGASATWTKTLTLGSVHAQAAHWYSFSTPVHHHANLPDGVNMGIIAVSEYGYEVEPYPKRVFVSEDYGLTWRLIFDPTPDPTQQHHHHGVEYDPWADAMWVNTGDGSIERQIAYSTNWRDATPTWIVVDTTVQCVGMIALPDCILLGTDAAPNGIMRIDRTAGGASYGPLQSAYAINAASSLTDLSRLIYRRPDGPILFSFSVVRGTTAGDEKGRIIATWNGRDFFPVWEEPTPYTSGTYPFGDFGVYAAMGPTAQGDYLAHLIEDSRNYGSHTAMRFPAPTWVKRTHAAAAMKYADQEVGDVSTRLAVFEGSSNTITGTNAVAFGKNALADKRGQKVHAFGRFAANGDAQASDVLLRATTTSATPVEMRIDATTPRFTLPTNSLWMFTIKVAATTVGGAEMNGYQYTGAIRRGSTGATALIGTMQELAFEEQVAWSVAVTADSTNAALDIEVTGEAGKTIRWVAEVHYVQVSG